MTRFPLGELKKTAHGVLFEKKKPIHYKELTKECLSRLGKDYSKREFQKTAEDLREKGLPSGNLGLAYIGRPHCVGVLSEWFCDRTLINVDSERIDFVPALVLVALEETKRRFRHIKNKYGRTPEEHFAVIFRGFLIELHVKWIFNLRWPDHYRLPANDGLYDQWCGHDFMVELPSGRTVTVDVAGPNRFGQYGAVANKPTADLYILAEIDEKGVVIRGVESSEKFRRERLYPEQAQSFTKLIVWLNCETGQHGYWTLAKALGQQPRTAA